MVDTDLQRFERVVQNLLAHPEVRRNFLQAAGVTDTLGRLRVQRANKVSRTEVDWKLAREALAARQAQK